MRIAGTLSCSLVNGEGIRYVVFVQGCAHGCPGCHNPETWDFGGGHEVSVEELAADIRKHRMIDGITLSGGDPMYQEAECLLLLDELPGMNVWVYTGFEWHEICDRELTRRADAVVTGPYVEELRCEGKYYGSSNQEVHRKDDLIRRSDVMREAEDCGLEINLKDLECVLNRVPTVSQDWLTGAEHEVAAPVEDHSDEDGCQMYTEYRNGVPVAYRYGEPWVAQQLLMEGGYKPPEEAKAAWLNGK